MADKNKIRLVTQDVPQDNQISRQPPKHGEPFGIYSFEERDRLTKKGFVTVPRNKRQRGKIAEAQRFRKAQGAYLSARLHFFDISQQSASQLRWWFASGYRIRIHHHIMVNYYLEDRPTPVEELHARNYCSVRQLHSDLKHAIDLGSIEVDHTKTDKRQRVIYPTRGLIADTDNLFGRHASEDHEFDGMFVFWSQQLGTYLKNEGEPGAAHYSLAQYHADFEAYNDLVGPHLPDTDRQF
jgi:hypothetical protein